MAHCREQEPDVDIRLFEVSVAEQIKGMKQDLYDVGFARWKEDGESIISEALWEDRLMITVPARHPLLVHKYLSLESVLSYPLILCHPDLYQGTYHQIQRILRHVNTTPSIVEYVATIDLMFALV